MVRHPLTVQDRPVDFNVTAYGKFSDMISDFTFQLNLRNYHWMSFHVVSKKSAHYYLKTLKYFCVWGYVSSSHNSIKPMHCNRLDAKAEMRILLSSANPDDRFFLFALIVLYIFFCTEMVLYIPLNKLCLPDQLNISSL